MKTPLAIVLLVIGCVWTILALRSYTDLFCHHGEYPGLVLFLYAYTFAALCLGILILSRRQQRALWKNLLWPILPWFACFALPAGFLIFVWAKATLFEIALPFRRIQTKEALANYPFAKEDLFHRTWEQCLPNGVSMNTFAEQDATRDKENLPAPPSRDTVQNWLRSCEPQYSLSFKKPVTVPVRGIPITFTRFILWSRYQCQDAPRDFAAFINDDLVVTMARSQSYSIAQIAELYSCQFNPDFRGLLAPFFYPWEETSPKCPQ